MTFCRSITVDNLENSGAASRLRESAAQRQNLADLAGYIARIDSD
jgi:hypothetical protein